MAHDASPLAAVARAGCLTVGELLAEQVLRTPERRAVDDGHRALSYRELDQRVNRLANALASLGVCRGERVAILAENRIEYLEATFAAARLGAILCALNWRLARDELAHCVGLVSPRVMLVSPRFAAALAAIGPIPAAVVALGDDYESRLGSSSPDRPAELAQPEDGLLILYTSGTTGLPKGALISHRAELARMALSRIDGGLQPGDGFVAWAPMFHMVSLEHAIHVLGCGGTVFVVDGAEVARLVSLIATEPQWWLVLIPGMIEPLVAALEAGAVTPRGIRVVGALADLVPGELLARTSALLRAPWWNTFGSTETGMLPAAGTRFAPGEMPPDLAKAPSSLCRWQLVDDNDRPVTPGVPGEMAVRGPTVFSGYWAADEVNAREFRGGWFHMGDLFVAGPDGRVSFVDRSRYMIKSGGENIYPMEIERVLMTDPRVLEAVVVRRRDPRWGEVPVAFVACRQPDVSAESLLRHCRAGLSSYKLPREIRFVASPEDFPRSTSGKIQRTRVEEWLDADGD
ncbi:MAG: AMP-binding protein [Betaproteobacteria bacterium]|nr:AMP-binding protein [Betaproteobacteria bacterium]